MDIEWQPYSLGMCDKSTEITETGHFFFILSNYLFLHFHYIVYVLHHIYCPKVTFRLEKNIGRVEIPETHTYFVCLM